MKKLYSIKGQDAGICHPIEYFREMLDERFLPGFLVGHVKQLELEVWTQQKGTEDFWCMELGEGFESTKDVCGRFCDSYAPRNGKSGRCRWHSSPYRPTGETRVIRRKGEG